MKSLQYLGQAEAFHSLLALPVMMSVYINISLFVTWQPRATSTPMTHLDMSVTNVLK
jgi:hypothetical protein